MSTFVSGRTSEFGGINVKQRNVSSLNGIRFNENRDSVPTSSADFILFRHAGVLKVWDGLL
jgi:hypothetical protein